MLRFLVRLLCFWRASENRAELRHDLRATHEAHRAKADYSAQDYRLKRDMEAMKDKDNS